MEHALEISSASNAATNSLTKKRHTLLAMLAEAHSSLGNVDEAEKAFGDAVQAHLDLGKVDEAQQLLGAHSQMLSKYGQRVKAKEVSQRRMELFPGVGATPPSPTSQAYSDHRQDLSKSTVTSAADDVQLQGDSEIGSGGSIEKIQHEVQMLLSVAKMNSSAGDYQSSATMLERAVPMAQASQDQSLVRRTCVHLAASYAFLGRAPDALKLMFDLYEKKNTEEGLGDEEAIIERTFATIYVMLGRYDDSMQHEQNALQLAAASGDIIEETSVYLDMSKVYLRLRKLEQCHALVKKALDLSTQSGNKDQLADAHNCMANVLLEMMKASRDTTSGSGHEHAKDLAAYEEVITHWRHALQVAESVENYEEQCCIHGNMAGLYLDIGELDRAEKEAEIALTMSRDLKSPSLQARIMMTKGDIMSRRQKIDSSTAEAILDVYTSALDIAKDANDKGVMATLLRKVGKTYAACSEWESAKYYLRSAYKYTREQGQTHLMANVLSDLSHAEHRCNEQGKREAPSRMRSVGQSISSGLRHRVDRWTSSFRRGTFSSSTIEDQLRAFASINDVESMKQILYPGTRGEQRKRRRRGRIRHVNINAYDDEQYTALHCAAKNGCMEAVKLLIEAGANPNVETLDYESPYRLALINAHLDVANYLRNRVGAMPFLTIEAIRLLEQRRRSGPDEADYRIFGAFHRLAWNGTRSADMTDHQEEDMFGRTTLHMACYRVQIDWVKERLKESTYEEENDLLKEDKEGWTALHWLAAAQVPSNRMARSNFSVQTIEMMNMLLRHEAKLLHRRTSKGETAMKLARTAGNKKLARELQRAGCREDSKLLSLLSIPLFMFLCCVYGLSFPVFVISAYLRPNCKITRLIGTTPQRVLRILSGANEDEDLDAEFATALDEESTVGRPAATKTPPVSTTSEKSMALAFARDADSGELLRKSAGLSDRMLIMIASGVLLAVWAFPFGMIGYIKENLNESGVYAWIGVYMGLIICFLWASIHHGLKDQDIRTVRHPQRHIRFQLLRSKEDVQRNTSLLYVHTRNFMNVLRIVFFIVDFAAFFNFALPFDMSHIAKEDSNAADALNEFRTQVDKLYLLSADFLLSFRLPFWLMTGAFAAWFILYSYMGLCLIVLRVRTLRALFPFVRQDFYSRIPQVEIIVPFLAIVGFLPISSVCFQALKCNYVSGSPTVPDLWNKVDNGTLWLEQNCFRPSTYDTTFERIASDAIDDAMMTVQMAKDEIARNSTIAGGNSTMTGGNMTNATDIVVSASLSSPIFLSPPETLATTTSITPAYFWKEFFDDGSVPLVLRSRDVNSTSGLYESVYCTHSDACPLPGGVSSVHTWRAVDMFSFVVTNATVADVISEVATDELQGLLFSSASAAANVTCDDFFSTSSCAIELLLPKDAADVGTTEFSISLLSYADTKKKTSSFNETLLESEAYLVPLVRQHRSRTPHSSMGTIHPRRRERYANLDVDDIFPVALGNSSWVCPRRVGSCQLYSGLYGIDTMNAHGVSPLPPSLPVVPVANTSTHTNTLGTRSQIGANLPRASCFETNDLPGQLSQSSCATLCASTTCERGVESCLGSDPKFVCWNNEHSAFAVVAMLIMAYYIPTVIAVGIYFSEPDTDTGDIRLSGIYVLVEYSFKWILAGCYTYFNDFPEGQEGVITQSLCFFVGLSLCWAHVSLKPIQNIWSLNHYRALSFAMVAWSSLITLAAIVHIDGRSIMDMVGDKSDNLASNMILFGMLALLIIFVSMHVLVVIFKAQPNAEKERKGSMSTDVQTGADLMSLGQRRRKKKDGASKSNKAHAWGKSRGTFHDNSNDKDKDKTGSLQMTFMKSVTVDLDVLDDGKKRKSFKNPLYFDCMQSNSSDTSSSAAAASNGHGAADTRNENGVTPASLAPVAKDAVSDYLSI